LNKRDWSLVFFTVMSQLSAGIILCFAMLHLLYANTGLRIDSSLSLGNPVLLALVLIGVATLLSTLHLGKPKNAPRALGNLPGSWLSREILAIGIYSLCLALTLAWDWKNGAEGISPYLLSASAIAALGLLWTMARVYMVPTILPWNTWYTPLSFVTTTLSLGPLAFLLLQAIGHIAPADQVTDFLSGLFSAMLLIDLVSAPVHHSRLVRLDDSIGKPVYDSGVFYHLFVIRMLLLIIAVLAIAALLQLSGDSPAASIRTWIYPLFALVLVEKVLGRLLFYSAYFRTGV